MLRVICFLCFIQFGCSGQNPKTMDLKPYIQNYLNVLEEIHTMDEPTLEILCNRKKDNKARRDSVIRNYRAVWDVRQDTSTYVLSYTFYKFDKKWHLGLGQGKLVIDLCKDKFNCAIDTKQSYVVSTPQYFGFGQLNVSFGQSIYESAPFFQLQLYNHSNSTSSEDRVSRLLIEKVIFPDALE